MHYLKLIFAWCLGLMIWSTGCASQAADQADFRADEHALNVPRDPAPYPRPDDLPSPAPDAGGKLALGDCGSVIDTSGRVDVAKTIDALVAMHMNTFAYSIGESPSAWEQLPEFADAAARRGITVWVYLMPWSESPAFRKNKAWCEPYRLDFVAWSRAVAELSTAHPNVAAILLDDFGANDTQPDRFTPEYLTKMKQAAAEYNPNLKLYTILYFDQPWTDFVNRFGSLVDGAVVCYPDSQAQIDCAFDYLSGRDHGASIILDMGRYDIGSRATTGMTASVHTIAGQRLRFLFDNANTSRFAGTHTMFVAINGKVVWWRRVAQRFQGEIVDIPLPASVRVPLKIELAVTGQNPTEKSTCVIRLDDVMIVARDGSSVPQPQWRLIDPGKVSATIAQAGPGDGKPIPMFLMPAAAPFEHVKTYKEQATPAAIGVKIRLCLTNARAGKAAGVIDFCTPKDESDPVMQLVSKLFGQVRSGYSQQY